MIHTLKILPKYFKAVASGKKSFELRKFDRDYAVDDVLHLVCIDENGSESTIVASVEYVLSNCSEYGLMDGYCILGINVITVL